MFLSFCIPTLNRAAYIGQCLDGIVDQWRDDVEVVILDGGSTDGTPEVVRPYLERHPTIRFIRTEVNRGIDADILAVADLAIGRYIWFLSDDDCLMPGAVDRVRRDLELNEWPAGASVNYVSFDATLTFRIATVPAISGHKNSHNVLYRSAGDCFSALGPHLGYLSAQIVRRDICREAKDKPSVKVSIGSCWIITALIGSILLLEPTWLYIHDPCLKNRTSNDSFIARLGIFKRQVIAHKTFKAVVETLFGSTSPVLHSIKLTMIRDRMPRTLVKLKSDRLPFEIQWQVLKLYLTEYAHLPQFWIRVFPIFLIPNTLCRIALGAYVRVSRLRHYATKSHGGVESQS